MELDPQTFNDVKVSYKKQVETLVSELSVGDYIAFIKDGKKYVLKIITLQQDTDTPDLEIHAAGVVWEGGIWSIDAVDVGEGISAGGYAPSNSVLYIDTWHWEDEMHLTKYLAIYSYEYPLILKGLNQTDTASFIDDMWEFSIIDQSTYESVLAGISNAVASGHYRIY